MTSTSASAVRSSLAGGTASAAGVAVTDDAIDVRDQASASPRSLRMAVVGNVDIVKFRGWLIEDLTARGHNVFACAPHLGDADLRKLAASGARYQRIALERTSINPLQTSVHIISLAAELRRLKIDVVLAHTTKAMIMGCLAARLARVPRIHAIVEGLGYAFAPGPERSRRLVRAVLTPAMRAALAGCDGVFVLNSDDRDYLIDLGVLTPRQRVTQIAGTGLDLDHYAYTPPTPGPPRFLLIARMIRDKGIGEYADAARIVKRRYPEARFRLLGPLDDHPTAISREQIAAWEAEGLVEYLGVTDDVRPYLADCSAFVLPTYYREGLPRTIMEAMAVGRPVVATDTPGCRDMIEHGVTGMLIPPRDVPALAEALLRLIDDPVLVLQAGLAGRARSEAHLSVASVNAAIEAELL